MPVVRFSATVNATDCGVAPPPLNRSAVGLAQLGLEALLALRR